MHVHAWYFQEERAAQAQLDCKTVLREGGGRSVQLWRKEDIGWQTTPRKAKRVEMEGIEPPT